MLFAIGCLSAFLILFVLPLWGLYRFIMRDSDENKLKTVYAELVDYWEYQGYNGFLTSRSGLGGSMNFKEKRYVGVFVTEDGEELSLRGDVPFDFINLHRKGILKYKKGWFCDFAEDQR